MITPGHFRVQYIATSKALLKSLHIFSQQVINSKMSRSFKANVSNVSIMLLTANGSANLNLMVCTV